MVGESTLIASRQAKTVAQWAKDAGYVEKQISGWRKGMGIAGFAIYEDIKLHEVLGTVTDGRMEFKRGVGFGFAMGPRLLPYGFGKFAKGKAFDLTLARKSNYAQPLNTFLPVIVFIPPGVSYNIPCEAKVS